MITAAKLAATRKRLDESQAAFAARFRVNQATISRWENSGPPEDGPSRYLIEKVLAEIENGVAA